MDALSIFSDRRNTVGRTRTPAAAAGDVTLQVDACDLCKGNLLFGASQQRPVAEGQHLGGPVSSDDHDRAGQEEEQPDGNLEDQKDEIKRTRA
jgi:hypothetical protein